MNWLLTMMNKKEKRLNQYGSGTFTLADEIT